MNEGVQFVITLYWEALWLSTIFTTANPSGQILERV